MNKQKENTQADVLKSYTTDRLMDRQKDNVQTDV